MSKVIELKDLKAFCSAALVKEGLCSEYADITGEVLGTNDAFGTHSHGTKNLHNYIRKMRLDAIERDSTPEIVKEGHDFALIDAHNVIGMVPAYKAMELAVEKAKDNAIACVLVKNAAHFAAAGYYSLQATKENMIGIACTCGDRNTCIPGGRGAGIGNNPLAYAIPSGKYDPIFLDIAFSTVAALKVVKAKNAGESVPLGWITDAEGLPTTDPSGFPDTVAMAALGAHKGYGLSMMVDNLTSVLSGGNMLMDITSWLYHLEDKTNVSHMFIAINVSKFQDVQAHQQRVEKYIDYLHAAPRAQGCERIYYPGEMEWDRYHKALDSGLALPDDVADSLIGLGEDVGIVIPWKSF